MVFRHDVAIDQFDTSENTSMTCEHRPGVRNMLDKMSAVWARYSIQSMTQFEAVTLRFALPEFSLAAHNAAN